MAKALKRAAEANGVSMKLTFAQNQIARMYGYRSYSDLKGCLGQAHPSKITRLTSDDYHQAAVSRLAADNGWPEEFAQGICERLKHIVDLWLMRANIAATGPERSFVVETVKRRSSERRLSQTSVKVFDLRHGGNERK